MKNRSSKHNARRQAEIRQRDGAVQATAGQVLLPNFGLPASRPKKSLGQHFLMHPAIARRIVHAAGIESTDTVLEVGPGKGMLTRALLDTGVRVIAVEADGALIEGLQTRFAPEIAKGRLELVHADIRTVEYQKFLATVTNFGYRVVANIPYYITGEIIRMFLENKHQPRSMTLLVQKEVAERIVAKGKKEGILSLSVKAYGEPHYEFTVPRGAFVPAPNVDSAVLSIRDISRKHFASPAEEKRFFALIHAGFAHKRKYLRSNLAGLVSTGALVAAGVPEKARAEDLALADWFILSNLS
ncbi:MAG: 16S rRNA (adenine(1518)-N(6)/adenine(1519)-N(6))-dimethyltransferase RsmA [bacterium]|nr:16S rRNA (adenine(1518)-N(6)/adenine(1519)-N(6))-dimethyltransferase RsmA [bacterium]